MNTEIKILGLEDEILELFHEYDNITQSDLQGAVYCIVRKIFELGKKEGIKE
jgi:hypothetical protein